MKTKKLILTFAHIIKEVNKILFNFIWKGKDKVKRATLISDVENGGLRAPHLESIVKTQRIMCCKKFAEEQQTSWKIILLHYLKQVGGKLILGCGYDLKKLPVKLPRFYEECLQSFAELSVETAADTLSMDKTQEWILEYGTISLHYVNGKSIFHDGLF